MSLSLVIRAGQYAKFALDFSIFTRNFVHAPSTRALEPLVTRPNQQVFLELTATRFTAVVAVLEAALDNVISNAPPAFNVNDAVRHWAHEAINMLAEASQSDAFYDALSVLMINVGVEMLRAAAIATQRDDSGCSVFLLDQDVNALVALVQNNRRDTAIAAVERCEFISAAAVTVLVSHCRTDQEAVVFFDAVSFELIEHMSALCFGDNAESSDLGRITERHALTLAQLHGCGFDRISACKMLVTNLWNKPQEVFAAIFAMHTALVSYLRRHNKHPNAQSAVAANWVVALMATLNENASESIMNYVIGSINNDVVIHKISTALDLTRNIAAEIVKLVMPKMHATGLQVSSQDIDLFHRHVYDTSLVLYPNAILAIVSSISRAASTKSLPLPDPFTGVYSEYWGHGVNVVSQCMSNHPRELHRVASVALTRITEIVEHHAILHGCYSTL
jgi:hypothetical protein